MQVRNLWEEFKIQTEPGGTPLLRVGAECVLVVTPSPAPPPSPSLSQSLADADAFKALLSDPRSKTTQHQEMASTWPLPAAAKQQLCWELIRQMSVHGSKEEEVLYPGECVGQCVLAWQVWWC